MSIKRFVSLFFILFVVFYLIQPAFAEEYPSKPIKFFIPFSAGSSADLMGRALADGAEKILGQEIVPVNRPGASGGIMYTALKNASPDGYTIGWNSTSIVTTTNMGNVPFKYDAFKNFCRIGFTAMPIVVKATSQWKNFGDFIEYARKNPYKIKIGNAGAGSGTHLVSVLMEKGAGIKVIHIPLGAKRRIPSLLGGEVEAISVPLPAVANIARSGQVRILAIPSEKRDPAFPKVPTFKELGYPIAMELFRGCSAPKGTPKEVVDKLNRAFLKGAQSEIFLKIARQKAFNISYMDEKGFSCYLKKQDGMVCEAMKVSGLIK